MEQFSRIHRGKPARLETAAPEAGVAGANALHLPLVGVTDERSSGQAPQRIHIVLGGPAHPHVDHVIPHPRKVSLVEWNDGYSALLQVESQDGWETSLRIGPPEQVLPPGMILDGLDAHNDVR